MGLIDLIGAGAWALVFWLFTRGPKCPGADCLGGLLREVRGTDGKLFRCPACDRAWVKRGEKFEPPGAAEPD